MAHEEKHNPAREGKRTTAERVEQLFERVRQMERGGNLEALLERECDEVKRLLYEQALGERAKVTASDEADFPPSGLS